jgi:TPP-dependent pyruvate/acetoin dehydrogenase alpha subunit
MLRQMILVRACEEKLEQLYQRNAMFGSTHSYRGQEAIAVGVCSALQSTDLIASYHRGPGHLIAKGADLHTLRGVSAELAALIQKIFSWISRSGRAYCRAADPAVAQSIIVRRDDSRR